MFRNDEKDIKTIKHWKNANIDSAIIENTNNVAMPGQTIKKKSKVIVVTYFSDVGEPLYIVSLPLFRRKEKRHLICNLWYLFGGRTCISISNSSGSVVRHFSLSRGSAEWSNRKKTIGRSRDILAMAGSFLIKFTTYRRTMTVHCEKGKEGPPSSRILARAPSRLPSPGLSTTV